MRYPADRKQQTRRKILQTAGRLFRRQGYQASGVDQVMEAAGLTSGGFYSHFASKAALFAEALAHVGAETRQQVDGWVDQLSGRAWVRVFLDRYLGKFHCERIEEGCALAALVSEVARADDSVKESFEAMVRELEQRLEAQAEPGPSPTGERAMAALSLCVGGLGLARAVKDEALAERILTSCRRQAEEILCDSKTPPKRSRTSGRQTGG